MSSEPNPNMDKLLRDYAKKRREEAGTPAEMHAATRKMLHAEVARTLGKKEATSTETRTTPKFVWWPSLAWSGAVTAALAVGLFAINHFLFQTEPKRTTLAALPKEVPSVEKELTRSEPLAFKPAPPSGRAENIPAPIAAPAPAPLAEVENKPAKASSYADEVRTRSAAEPVPASAVAKPSAAPATVAATPAPVRQKAKDSLYLEKEADGSVLPTNSLDSLAAVRDRSSTGAAFAGDMSKKVSSTNFLATGTSGLNNLSDRQKERLAFGKSDADGAASFATASSGSLSASTYNREAQPGLGGRVDSRNLTQQVATVSVPALEVNSFKQESAKLAAPAESKIAAAKQSVVGQNYRQQNLRANLRVNLQSPPQPDVLSNFQIVWNGSQVKIIDADGSVYEGVVKPQFAEQNKVAKRKIAVGASQSAGQQNTTFRVVGLNRTLNQKIVFEGTALNVSQTRAFDSVAKSVGGKSSAADAQVLADKKEDAPATPTQNIIRGSVNVGGTDEFKIEAIQSP